MPPSFTKQVIWYVPTVGKVAVVEELLLLVVLGLLLNVTPAGLELHVNVNWLLPPGQLELLPLRVAVKLSVDPLVTVCVPVRFSVTLGCAAAFSLKRSANTIQVNNPFTCVKVFMLMVLCRQ